MSIIKSLFFIRKVKVKTWLKNIRDYVQCINMGFLMKGELAATGSTELICIKEDTFKPMQVGSLFPRLAWSL